MSRTAGIIVGSIRRDGIHQQIANHLLAHAPEGLAFRQIDISKVSFYDPSNDGDNRPSEWTSLREAVKSVDGLLFLTPEYNRSVPGYLKNAIDVLSRPYGQAAISGKPSAIISASPGALGGFGAHHHLRQILACLNTPQMPAPEAYLSGVNDEWFAKEGSLKFLDSIAATFAAWVEKTS